jgi:chromate transporter
LLGFFLKAGSLTFGSGLVIVPFLQKGLVQQSGRLNGRQFLVAVGMISPGPVGSLVSTVGIFLPSFLLILIVAPLKPITLDSQYRREAQENHSHGREER